MECRGGGTSPGGRGEEWEGEGGGESKREEEEVRGWKDEGGGGRGGKMRGGRKGIELGFVCLEMSRLHVLSVGGGGQ